jgi:hypothetical protein
MDNETKGKLVDGAIVTAKTTAMLLLSGALGHSGGGGIFPRPINMWRNQRAQREYREQLRKCIASGAFRYRGYQVEIAEQSGDQKRWGFCVIGADDWQDYRDSAEECMRQIDKLANP